MYVTFLLAKSMVQVLTSSPLACSYTGELGYDRLNGTRKMGPSYAKSVVYIGRILDMHRTGTKHIVRHMQKSVIQRSVISKFTCIEIVLGRSLHVTTDIKPPGGTL